MRGVTTSSCQEATSLASLKSLKEKDYRLTTRHSGRREFFLVAPVFLLLCNPREVKSPGKILIINERNDRPSRYVKFATTFDEDNELLPL